MSRSSGWIGSAALLAALLAPQSALIQVWKAVSTTSRILS